MKKYKVTLYTNCIMFQVLKPTKKLEQIKTNFRILELNFCMTYISRFFSFQKTNDFLDDIFKTQNPARGNSKYLKAQSV